MITPKYVQIVILNRIKSFENKRLIMYKKTTFSEMLTSALSVVVNQKSQKKHVPIVGSIFQKSNMMLPGSMKKN